MSDTNKEKRDGDFWIRTLGLEGHPGTCGGFFRQTFASSGSVSAGRPDGQPRKAVTAVYFLQRGNQRTNFHAVMSDETMLYHAGLPMTIVYLDADHEEQAVRQVLGPDPSQGHK